MIYPQSLIRQKRLNSGLSISEQAAKLTPPCGRITLGLIETGRLHASNDIQRRIADYWRVSIDELFDSTGRARFADK